MYLSPCSDIAYLSRCVTVCNTFQSFFFLLSNLVSGRIETQIMILEKLVLRKSPNDSLKTTLLTGIFSWSSKRSTFESWPQFEVISHNIQETYLKWHNEHKA